jgi:hypothetical protein
LRSEIGRHLYPMLTYRGRWSRPRDPPRLLLRGTSCLL